MADFFSRLRRNEVALVLCLSILFVLVRIPSVDRPLHQDEYKWPMLTNPAYVSDAIVPHPPLTQLVYRVAGYVVGYDVDFRYVPLFFGTLNLVLLYMLVRMLYDQRTALVAVVLWCLSFFSVLASLMVDTDGEILPFFFLLALIAYEKIKRAPEGGRMRWVGVLLAACVLGMLVKLSFIIAVGALAADFLWSRRKAMTTRTFLTYVGYGGGGVLVLAVLLFSAPYVFPYFDLGRSLAYWTHFFTANRGWFQTAIQCVKAVLYASPLILVPLFAPRAVYAPLRPLLFFLGFAFIFYVLLFDFSGAALDRYLQLIVLPLCAFAGVSIATVFGGESNAAQKMDVRYVIGGSVVALLLALMQGVDQYVPPLHPKSDWITRAATLQWHFLFPFHGGSGPLGFYVSFFFIGVAWIIVCAAWVYAVRRPTLRTALLAFALPVVLMYNLVFIEEYHFGYINGSAPRVLERAIAYMRQDPTITQVRVYNDNGGDEVRQIGKYERRLYVDPKFNTSNTVLQFDNHVLQIDIPRPPAGAYERSFDACDEVFKETDAYISATIFDCRKDR